MAVNSEPGLGNIVKPIGDVERDECFVTVYDAKKQPMYSFCTVDRSIKVYDNKGKVIFQVEPQFQGTLQITNKTRFSEKAFAKYLDMQANLAKKMLPHGDASTQNHLTHMAANAPDNDTQAYLSAYHLLTDTAKTINSGAYMRITRGGK